MSLGFDIKALMCNVCTYMRHIGKRWLIWLLVVLCACTSLFGTVSGHFTKTSKYGNMDTTIKSEDFESQGFELGDVCTITIGDTIYDAPYVRSYGDVEPGNCLFHDHYGVLEFAICYGNYANTYGFKEGDTVSITLKQKAGYLDTFLIRDIHSSEKREDYASDTIFANVRPVVLGEIGFNKLYRSCNPILGDARGPYAYWLLQNCGIRTIINLADKQEDLLPMAEKMNPYGFYAQLVRSQDVIGCDMGIAFFDDEFIKKLHDALVFMAEHQSPYLIHCNEGRDRAGYLAALLEGLMGASVSEIYNDYMASFDHYFGIKEGTKQYAAYVKVQHDQMMKVNGGVEITDQNVCEGVRSYLINTIGLTSAQVDLLKAKLR